MNRTKGIVVAGTITGLVLITILALGFGSVRRSLASEAAGLTTSVEIAAPAPTDPGSDQALEAWQTYGAELEQTVRILQEREAVYQQQLEAANQTITQLQDQINQANSSPFTSFLGEHEFGEHEEHRFGGFDD